MRKSLVLAVVVTMLFAASTYANTIASSTMYFQGTLTPGTSGYTGTIDAVAGTYYIPGGPGTTWDGSQWVTPDGRAAVGGFDLYALEGGTACYDDVVQGVIGSDHDAYSEAGGWGDFWSPDVPDWDNYQLTLTEDHWYLEYKGAALGTPMSGTLNWATLLACETDLGSYRGTVPADPDSNDGGAAALGGGAGAWDMDWTWGSEVIPLQYSCFDVDVNPLGSGVYEVSLTPHVPAPGAVLLGSLGAGLVGWFRRKRVLA